MKLFSPNEIKSTKETELTRDLLRTKDIKEALDKVRTELNETNALFESTLAGQRVRWVSEEEEASNRIKELTREVQELENKRKQLIIPIDLDRIKADNMIIEANELLEAVNRKQAEVNELSEKLEEKLDTVGEKEQELDTLESTLIVRAKGIEGQQMLIKEVSENLSKQTQSILEEMEAKDKAQNERKIILDLQEQTNNHIIETIKEREAEIEKDKELIKSQRETLKAAYKELNK